MKYGNSMSALQDYLFEMMDAVSNEYPAVSGNESKASGADGCSVAERN